MAITNPHRRCRLKNGPRYSDLWAAVRRTNFWRQLPDRSIAIIVSNPERTRSRDTEYSYRQNSDILYLNGFPEPESALVFSKLDPRVPHLIMFVRPKDHQREIWTGIRYGVEGARKHFGADEAHPVDQFEKVVGKLLDQAGQVFYRFGVNPEFDQRFRPLWEGKQKPLHNPDSILNELRLFKSEHELDLMRHAAAISAEGHLEAMRVCRPGMYEYEVQSALEHTFRIHGAPNTAYGSIVAAGNNAVILHYTENASIIRDGDLVLIDAACEYQGYAADITRTFPACGRFTPAQKDIYQVVLDAQEAAIKAACPGVPLASVHTAAQVALCQGLVRLGILPASALVGDYINQHGTGQYSKKAGARRKLHLLDLFMHGTSHWLGLDVHDVGSYDTADGTRTDKGRGKQRPLQPGMVITVEPGLYLDSPDPDLKKLIHKTVPRKYWGIGIRIEDDIVITADGRENITTGVPKAIDEIEALMSRNSKRRRRR